MCYTEFAEVTVVSGSCFAFNHAYNPSAALVSPVASATTRTRNWRGTALRCNMKQIPLTNGKMAIVDDADHEWLSQWKWSATSPNKGNKWYAARDAGGKRVSMHRQITDAPKGMVVDHINGNGLDNRRENLRVCTYRENSFNHKLSKRSTTGYMGVALDNGRRYVAHLQVAGQKKRIGWFKTAEEAARARDAAAKMYYGEFATLNFPEE
jgi:hypothetical protein